MTFESLIRELKPEEFPSPYNEMAELIGVDATISIMKHFGGEKVYLPVEKETERVIRNALIRQEFTGFNVRELAKKYRMSVNGILQVLRQK